VKFDLIGAHLDQGQPGYDGRALTRWLEDLGTPHEIIREDIYGAARAIAGPTESICGPCSRLRRGALYTTAGRLGCNKIALGHHRDDALETFFLNMLYAGRLQAMPARYVTNDGRFEVIRPLIECAEEDIARHASDAGYPVMPSTLCSPQAGRKRESMARLLEEIEKLVPNARQVMMGALRNVRATHLLDKEVAEAWAAAAGRYRPRR